MRDKITFRITPDLAEAFERFMDETEDRPCTAQEAFRLILRDWLTGRGYLETPPDCEDAN